MKKVFLFLALSTGVAFASHAQQVDSTAKKHHGQYMKHDKNPLGLTADQQAKVKAINDDARTKEQAVRGNASLTADQKKQQIKSIHEAQETSFKGVLTPDQETKRAQMHADRQAKKAEKKAAASTSGN